MQSRGVPPLPPQKGVFSTTPMNEGLTQRLGPSTGARRRFSQAGRIRAGFMRRVSGLMEKAVSGAVLIHVKREGRVNPSQRANTPASLKRSNPPRCKRLGEQGGAMKPSGLSGDAQTSIQFLPPRSELTSSVASIAPSSVAIDLKNTTNLDKFR